MLADDETRRPIPIRPDPDNLPDEIKQLRQWVLWRYLPPLRASEKWRKVPYTPEGNKASTTRSTSWCDFEDILAAYSTGEFDGIGFVVQSSNGLVGIDIDHCRNAETGEIPEWVQKTIDRFDTYTETSVSGTGIHMLIRAEFPAAERKKSEPFEIYQEKRFFTVTGVPLHSKRTIEERQEILNHLRARLFPKSIKPQQTEPVMTLKYEDAQILELVAQTNSAAAFQALYNGDAAASGRYQRADGTVDLSRADFALIGYVKQYTTDEAQIARILNASGLRRPKWEERRGAETWLQYTIHRALAESDPSYRPSLPVHTNGTPKHDREEPHESDQEASDDDQESESDAEESADDQTPAPRYVLHHISEAFEPQPPVPWVIEELLTRGSVALFVGAGGSKKTYTVLDMAACVANGLPWLDFPTTQGTVLIIDEESGDRRLKLRFMEVMRAHELDATSPIWYTTIAGFNLRNPVDVAHVSALVESVQPSVVIIDALVDIMPGGDENAAQDVHPVFHALRRIAERYECAVIIIHHSGKSGEYRGSTSMHGAVDLMLMVKSPPKESYVVFESVKVRDTEDISFTALAQWDSLRKTFNLSRVSVLPRAARFTDSELYVLDYLRKAPSHRASLMEIQDHADTCSEAMARKATRNLTLRGFVRRVDRGGPGSKAVYELTNQTANQETTRQ